MGHTSNCSPSHVRATPKTACPSGSPVSMGQMLQRVRRDFALKAGVSPRISAVRPPSDRACQRFPVSDKPVYRELRMSSPRKSLSDIRAPVCPRSRKTRRFPVHCRPPQLTFEPSRGGVHGECPMVCFCLLISRPLSCHAEVAVPLDNLPCTPLLHRGARAGQSGFW